MLLLRLTYSKKVLYIYFIISHLLLLFLYFKFYSSLIFLTLLYLCFLHSFNYEDSFFYFKNWCESYVIKYLQNRNNYLFHHSIATDVLITYFFFTKSLKLEHRLVLLTSWICNFPILFCNVIDHVIHIYFSACEYKNLFSIEGVHKTNILTINLHHNFLR